MAQSDRADGSQYDFVDPPWSQERLLASLEDALALMGTTDDPVLRGQRREIVISINYDLGALHGIDLGPF